MQARADIAGAAIAAPPEFAHQVGCRGVPRPVPLSKGKLAALGAGGAP